MNIKQKLDYVISQSNTYPLQGGSHIEAVHVDQLHLLRGQIDTYRKSLIQMSREAGCTEGDCEDKADQILTDTFLGQKIEALTAENDRLSSECFRMQKEAFERKPSPEASGDAKLLALRAWLLGERSLPFDETGRPVVTCHSPLNVRGSLTLMVLDRLIAEPDGGDDGE